MWSDRKQQLWIWRERGSRVEGQVDWEHRLQSLLAAWKALSAKSQYSSPHSSPHASPHASLSMPRQEPWKRLIRRPKNNSHTFVHNPRLGSSRQSAEDVSIFHERTSQFHITTTVTTGLTCGCWNVRYFSTDIHVVTRVFTTGQILGHACERTHVCQSVSTRSISERFCY